MESSRLSLTEEIPMKKILVALDNSKAAPIVLDQAIALAKPDKAELILFQAVTLPVDVPVDIYYRPKQKVDQCYFLSL